jgi:hypothetical protein
MFFFLFVFLFVVAASLKEGSERNAAKLKEGRKERR